MNLKLFIVPPIRDKEISLLNNYKFQILHNNKIKLYKMAKFRNNLPKGNKIVN